MKQNKFMWLDLEQLLRYKIKGNLDLVHLKFTLIFFFLGEIMNGS